MIINTQFHKKSKSFIIQYGFCELNLRYDYFSKYEVLNTG